MDGSLPASIGPAAPATPGRACEPGGRGPQPASPVGIATIDLNGRLSDINPAFAAIYGYRPGELLGRDFTMLCLPAQRAQALAQHRRFLSEADAPEVDGCVLQRDGAVLSVIERSVRTTDANGKPCRVLHVLDDRQGRPSDRVLRASNRFVQSVLDGLAAHVCVIDHTGVVLAVNRAWRAFAAENGGRAGGVEEGANYVAVCQAAIRSGQPDAGEAARFLALLRETLAGRRDRFEFEYPCHSPDTERWFIARVSRIEGSEPPVVVVSHDDVSALKQAQATLRLQASTDDLTGLFNRRSFRQAIDAEFERVRRRPGLRSAVLVFDIDRFKLVNDTWGHAAGDAMLRHVAQRVRGQSRAMDALGRIGGEEFAVLLPDTALEEALALARRVGRDVAVHPLSLGGHEIAATVSVGVALLDAADPSAEAALMRADQAMYDAKRAGRNAVRWRGGPA